jgi:hypothetical protein
MSDARQNCGRPSYFWDVVILSVFLLWLVVVFFPFVVDLVVPLSAANATVPVKSDKPSITLTIFFI